MKFISKTAVLILAIAVLNACGGASSKSSNSTTSTPASTSQPGALEFAAASLSVSQSAGEVAVTVMRTGGTGGAVSVGYATAAGSANPGTNYSSAKGTLTWTSGDATSRTISIAVSGSPSFSGNKAFTVILTSPSGGATLGAVATATVTIAGSQTVVAAVPASIEIAASTYSVTQGAGSVSVSVDRSGGSSGAVSVAYATANGTAAAGTNYTSTTGTLSWAAGDTSAKSILVPVASSPSFTGSKTFTVTLSAPTGGANLGSVSTATVNITGGTTAVTTPSNLSVRVQGNHLIDAQGNPLQLRGVNLSGLEFVAVQGWSAQDPWGGQTPNWSAIKAWKANVVRIPLNEDSWLGIDCIDTKSGAARSADPGKNYQATVSKAVDDATAQGFYVILDLHWVAPGKYCAMMQLPMADADNSLNFWTSVANTYKSHANVMFELFNEPFITGDPHFTAEGNSTIGWEYLELGLGGASFTGFNDTDTAGGWDDVKFNWQGASYQAMINAVRATGATNVVIAGSLDWSQDLSGWLVNHANDPLHQLAASWHAYPTFGAAFGSAAETQPNHSPQVWTEAQGILDGGFPILVTEIGENCAAGTTSSPEVKNVTTWADARVVSVLGWTWDVWSSPGATQCEAVLILDSKGTPTPGFGQYFHDWMVNHQ